MTFNVIDSPWIPVVYCDGHETEIDLRTALVDAHTIREIHDPLLTAEFGMYRLLVALVHDIFRPDDMHALNRLLEDKQFDASEIDKYFERYHDRFELFDPFHPFLQTGGMELEEEKPLSGLLAAVPSGTNATHFHHAGEDEFGAGPAAAARLLTTLAPFMTAGGAGLSPSINGAPPWYVLLAGETLFETLCLNTCVQLHETLKGDCLPAWRQEQPPAAERATQARLLEGLTWRPRRIQLIAGQAGQCTLTGKQEETIVRTMRFSAGASVDFTWHDPNVAYRINAKGRFPLRPREDHALWRDTGPLALLQEGSVFGKGEQYARPQVVAQAIKLWEDYLITRPLNLTVYGMRTDMKMKVFEWHRETLNIPLGVAREGVKCGEAQSAMELAENVAYILRQAMKQASPRKGATDAFAARTTRAMREYWHVIHEDYDRLLYSLAELPTGDPIAADNAQLVWQKALYQKSTKIYDDVLHDMDSSADDIRRTVEGKAYLRRNLAKPLAYYFQVKKAGKDAEQSGKEKT